MMQPPISQKIHHSDEEDPLGSKVCRICLEDDSPETMIAPCLCKGSQKWVHRDCLDLWRTNESDRAFSRCTECLYEYRMQPTSNRNRHFKFYLFVTRDILFMTLLVQAVIISAASVIYAIDRNQTIVEGIAGSEGCIDKGNFWCNHVLSLYYLSGLFAVLVVLGVMGSIFLCSHNCSIASAWRTIHSEQDQSARGQTTINHAPSYQQGQTHRYRHIRRRRNGGDCTRCCDDTCESCFWFGPHRYGYYYPSDPDCCCCCYDCDGCGDCDCGVHSGGGDHDCGDGAHVLLVVLLVVAVIMSIIGFVCGVVLAVVAGQRIVQRHIFLQQKRRLVHEFPVLDLSQYNITVPEVESHPSAPLEPVEKLDTMTPLAPPENNLDPKDRNALKKLGLVD